MPKYVSTDRCEATHKQSDMQFSEIKMDIKEIKVLLTNHVEHIREDITELKLKVLNIEEKFIEMESNRKETERNHLTTIAIIVTGVVAVTELVFRFFLK